MPRARLVKPGFFANEILTEIHPFGRLLFIGLWTLADREGRLPDRPKWIKGSVFPYESVPVERLLAELDGLGFILRYKADDGESYIQIVKFKKHQNPHIKEQASLIPAPKGWGESQTNTVLVRENPVLVPEKAITSPAVNVLNTVPIPITVPIPVPVAVLEDGVGVVAKVYENEIGSLTGMVKEEIIALLEDHPLECILDAFKKAVAANKRSIAYVKGICRNHKAKGSCIDERPATGLSQGNGFPEPGGLRLGNYDFPEFVLDP